MRDSGGEVVSGRSVFRVMIVVQEGLANDDGIRWLPNPVDNGFLITQDFVALGGWSGLVKDAFSAVWKQLNVSAAAE